MALSGRLAILLTATSFSAFAGAGVSGCSDDSTAVPPGGTIYTRDAASDAPSTEDATPVDTAALVTRGKYLVDVVADCGSCHTPRNPDGSPIIAKYLSGSDCFIDVNGPGPGGCLHTSNLTNHDSGLKLRSNQEIKEMFQQGVRPSGKSLIPVMPYWVFANMTADDANSIVAYLRTVPGVDRVTPKHDEPWASIPNVPSSPLNPAQIPPAQGDSASRGRYLSSMVGLCIDCHTPDVPPGPNVPHPIDMTKPFSGGHGYMLGLPNPPFPPVIYSTNLTSDATGTKDWSVEEIVKAMKEGKDKAGGTICPPHPGGPMGSLGGLTPQDATDIATYIKQLPAIANTPPGTCALP